MLNKLLLAAAIVLAAISMAAIAPAYAQASRTWVSGVGDDANPCSRTAPCKTFAGAISKTAAKGEINCLDSAGFGGVTITKSISIICNGVIGGVLVSGTNGIVVNLPADSDRVILDGLDINGLGTGLDGIRQVGFGQVVVRNTSIYGFTQEGIDLSAGASGRVAVIDSFIYNNGGGINVGNVASNSLRIDNATVEANTNFALKVAAASFVVMSWTKLTGSPVGINAAAGATIQSYGNNVIRGTGAPTAQVPLQ